MFQAMKNMKYCNFFVAGLVVLKNMGATLQGGCLIFFFLEWFSYFSVNPITRLRPVWQWRGPKCIFDRIYKTDTKMKLTNCIPNPFTSLRSLVFVASLSLSLSGTNSCNLASTRKWENPEKCFRTGHQKHLLENLVCQLCLAFLDDLR